MKKVTILALHLAYGGIEKAVSELANLFAGQFEVEILSVYDMPNAPAYPIDPRVKITYLLKDVPNRQELREALSEKSPGKLLKEGARAARILTEKQTAVIKAIRNISSGIVIATRDEHAVLLSKFGRDGVMKVMQLHQDHGYDRALVRHFQKDYGRIDLFALLSPKMEREVKELMRSNTHTKVVYLPNFMEALPPEADWASKEKTVIAVGRLHPVKGYDRLIRLFAAVHPACPEWRLVILGSGDEQAALEKEIEACGASSYITLAGRRSPEEVEQEMAKASLYALSSHSEGFPFVLLEAMSNSLPIVAFDTRGGLDMLVKTGENGYLVTQEEAFCKALTHLMQDDTLRRNMAQRSRELSLQFSRDEVAKIWFRLIEEYFHES